jgi:predicted DNA-binding protein with PD1-like motif
MKTKLLHQDGQSRTFVAILSEGDEAMSCLQQFARKEGLTAAHISALGAFSDAELKFFDWESKEYLPIPVREQVEVASLVGDIAVDANGEPALHIHVVLGKRDGSAVAGHLGKGRVRPTLEVVIEETPAHLCRLEDPKTGLALIRLEK